MQLHEDKEIFVDFISHIANASGYRQDVLEKDYYIVAFLKELASLQEDGLHAYFKGAVVVKIVVTKNILKLIVPSEPLTAISTMLRNTLSVDAALLPLTEYPTA